MANKDRVLLENSASKRGCEDAARQDDAYLAGFVTSHAGADIESLGGQHGVHAYAVEVARADAEEPADYFRTVNGSVMAFSGDPGDGKLVGGNLAAAGKVAGSFEFETESDRLNAIESASERAANDKVGKQKDPWSNKEWTAAYWKSHGALDKALPLAKPKSAEAAKPAAKPKLKK
jgi:hypothetical protein